MKVSFIVLLSILYRLIHFTMRSILADEKTTLTKLDLMKRCRALTWIIGICVMTVIAIVCSFAPPNTSVTRFRSDSLIAPSLSTISYTATSSGWSALNSFILIYVAPRLSDSAVDTVVSFTISGIVETTELGERIKNTTISGTYETQCRNGRCDEIRIYQDNRVAFTDVLMSATLETDMPIMSEFSFHVYCNSSVITVTSFVVISIMTFIVAMLLLVVVPRRLRPAMSDHWATLYLGLFIFLCDGPWLILKYYTPNVASQIFDLAPEVFHVSFMIFVTFFVSSRTVGLPSRLFNSWILRGVIIATSFVLIVLEFCVTGLMPLCTLSIYVQTSALQYPIYIISGILHVLLIGLLIFGVISLQIENCLVMTLVSLVFFVLEAIYVVRMYIRFFIPIATVGAAFAGDVFYILMANIVTIFLLMTNLPVQSGLVAEEPAEIITEPSVENV